MPVTAQLVLQLDPTPRLRRGHVVEPRAETGELYEAVLALRRRGRTVYRAGADHKVDGRLLSTRQLVDLARHAMGATIGADI